MAQPAVVLEVPRDSRLACVGFTGTGKSYFARAMFNARRGRRVVVDPFDDPDITVGPRGKATPELERWPTTREPTVDFGRSGTWRAVPSDPEDLDWFDALYKHLFEIGNVMIWNDEIGAAAPSRQFPLGVRQVLYQGRKRNISHIACSPSPVNVNPGVWRQADRWAIFQLPYAPDRETVAAHAALSRKQFDEWHTQLGEHGFIWWEPRSRKLVVLQDGLRVRRSGPKTDADDEKDDEPE